MTTPTTEQVGKEVKDRYMTIRIPFDIEVAGQDDLVSLLTHGIPVELAGGPATADMFEEAAITNPGGTD